MYIFPDVFSGRLSWLVYIIGSVIGGRVSFASTDEHDAMDGELVCRSVAVVSLEYSKFMKIQTL